MLTTKPLGIEVCLVVLEEKGAFAMFPLAVQALVIDGIPSFAHRGRHLLSGVLGFAKARDGTKVRLLSERYAVIRCDAEGVMLPQHRHWLAGAMMQKAPTGSDPPPWSPGPKQRLELLRACGVRGNLLRLVRNE